MTGRQTFMYRAIFEFLRDDLNIKVNIFMSDFEKPARNAARAVWPDAELKGCYVHFCRALTKKSRSFGDLGAAIRAGGDAKIAFKMYQRLAYLPRTRRNQGIQAIMTFINNKDLKHLFQDFHR